ncbi:gp53-like domain-containing protein [Citrobacter youngae]|uniref:gp53-like domain-containing protein n=1 Tax=Citrobacter youngae TaxID=133448 RepID=UPI000E1AD293|nr:hypothetical protein [Citrobacter youngae]SUX97520.1 phage tail fiber protein [Citrobacter youngae]
MLRIGQVESSATADGKYTDGSVAGGIAATRLRAAAFNAIQEELANIVESAGMTLSPDDMTQVLTALKKQFLSRTNPFADIKSDGTAAVATALSNLGLGEAAKRDVGTGTNQIPDMSKWTSLKADYGWRLTPDGFLEQWGRGNYGNGDGDFVIPFPNRCAFVLISSDPNDTSYAEISQAFPVSNSKFRVGCATAEGNNVNPANLTCNWYAKGW